jgi:hypothetical protein
VRLPDVDNLTGYHGARNANMIPVHTYEFLAANLLNQAWLNELVDEYLHSADIHLQPAPAHSVLPAVSQFCITHTPAYAYREVADANQSPLICCDRL